MGVKALKKKNFKIGIMGLAEEEWLGILTYSDEIIQYEDFIVSAKRYIKKFQDAQCDLIIALTHMRTVNISILSREIYKI